MLKNKKLILLLLVVPVFAASCGETSNYYEKGYNDNRGNTALGNDALKSNTNGAKNIAIGKGTLQSSTVGNFSVAIGVDALRDFVATGLEENTAIGAVALMRLTTGNNNVSVGGDSMPFTTTGNFNTALGQFSGLINSTGSKNSFIGYGTSGNTTGDNNTYLGYRAGTNDIENTGSYNTFIGAETGPSLEQAILTNVTALGYRAKVADSNTMILGATYGQTANEIKIGAGTNSPSTKFEIFAIQPQLHSIAKTQRGILAITDAYGNDFANNNPAIPTANTGGGISFGGFINSTEFSSWAAVKGNKLNAISGDGTGYFDIYVADSLGVMQSKIRVHSGGDVEVKTPGRGIILTNASGFVTKRVRLNDAGNGFVFEDP